LFLFRRTTVFTNISDASLDGDRLTSSPIDFKNLFPYLPLASPIEVLEQDGNDGSVVQISDDEDGLDDTLALQHQVDHKDEGSFGDVEQVVVATDQYSWKIDHARGDYKIKGLLSILTKESG
jgi:hypothetical protein